MLLEAREERWRPPPCPILAVMCDLLTVRVSPPASSVDFLRLARRKVPVQRRSLQVRGAPIVYIFTSRSCASKMPPIDRPAWWWCLFRFVALLSLDSCEWRMAICFCRADLSLLSIPRMHASFTLEAGAFTPSPSLSYGRQCSYNAGGTSNERNGFAQC